MYELLIGLRYTRASRRNGFISFISLISVVGIALGVAALIIVLSVMNGFQAEVRNRILGMAAHVQISGVGNQLQDWQTTATIAKKNPHVLATAPYVLGQGLLINGSQVKGALVRGIDPQQESKVNEVAGKLVAGELHSLRSGEFGIILGISLANELSVRLGDRVTMITPQGQVTPAGLIPRMKQFTVAGIFKADYAPYDIGLAMVDIKDAQTLFRTGSAVSGVRLKLDDLNLARRVSREINQEMPELIASDWSQENPTYFRAVEIEKRMMFIILTLIVAVAAFNLVSTLVMVVTDKQADIAILRTLGASPFSIMKIFVIQGALSGVIGTGSGVLAGVLVSKNLDVIVPFIERILGTTILSPDIYLISELPSRVLWSDVSSIGGISLLLALLATLYPSWRASRVNPAEALRYE
ncbi:lipoprotein-releasing ABC transporter permease subunit [Iodobacter fluviatilis]|jgi:lipoprotein-releasing system permease protein|uniref:Lipoprotein-releasing system transmembrane subunit LolC n=1 Tax=Iodobacter fluviatilis TaxID=537 RepID=A0A7G3G5V8_9NEIS|nr:lipoprotein-releasing ABC transporter permease subunit [Iodobacter fluviatilis]QBC42225.1 lipoprotein-releasing system transmembrane subunit LolC [Iodobacter fluviatilis]